MLFDTHCETAASLIPAKTRHRPIPNELTVFAPFLGKPLIARHPWKTRLPSVFERTNHVLLVFAASRVTAWRKPFEQRIPSYASLPPLPVRRTRFDTLVPSRKSFVALLLSETNIGTIPSECAFRSTPLEPTSSCPLPMFRTLAPLVFSANQTSHDTH